jgi:hypothetical protein
MKTAMSALVLCACAHARTADEYRDATASALATQEAGIKSCYDQLLATTPTAAGRVTVRFSIAEKTGRVTDAKLDAAQTTAPEAIGHCVLAAIPAVAITPGDRKRGEATWSWNFAVGSAQPASTAGQ